MSIKDFFIKNEAELLTGFGVGLLGLSLIFMHQDAPKALTLLKEKKLDKGSELTITEKTPILVKSYWRTLISAGGAVTCFVLANKVHSDRYAMLSGAYSFVLAEAKNFKDSTSEVVGKNQMKKIANDIGDKAYRNDKPEIPQINNTNIIGNQSLFYDRLTKQAFWSDIESVRSRMNDANAAMLHDTEGGFSVNEYCDLFGLNHLRLNYDGIDGDNIGWNQTDGLIDYDISTSTILPDGRVAIVIIHFNPPKDNFWRRYH